MTALISPAGAFTLDPPSGKYLDVRNGNVYLYNAATNSVTLTSDPVSTPVCYVDHTWPDSGSEGKCGQCGYSANDWTSTTTLYTEAAGYCLDVLSEPVYGVYNYNAWYRADARVIDSEAWSYHPMVAAMGTSNFHIYDPEACDSVTVPNVGIVSYCHWGPEKAFHSQNTPYAMWWNSWDAGSAYTVGTDARACSPDAPRSQTYCP